MNTWEGKADSSEEIRGIGYEVTGSDIFILELSCNFHYSFLNSNSSHSVLKLFTGFANAAFAVCMHIKTAVIKPKTKTDNKNGCAVISIL